MRNPLPSHACAGAVGIVLLSGMLAPAATFTSKSSGNWNSSGRTTWNEAGTPGAGDAATIQSGHVVTITADVTIGSKTSAVGHAVTIAGATPTTFGELKVAGGATLTLRGFDRGPDLLMQINRYGKFSPQPGATILLDLPSDMNSFINDDGIINSVGTPGSPITWSIPASNFSWNNQVTNYVGTNGGVAVLYDHAAKIYASLLDATAAHGRWISNSAGTGIGSFGDSSLIISAQNPVYFSTEVASIAACNAPGKYYVDYGAGVVYWYFAGAPAHNDTLTISYKYLVIVGGGLIHAQANWDYNEAIFDYNTFNYFGPQGIDFEEHALFFTYKNSTASASNRRAQVTNSTFNYCSQCIGLSVVIGTAPDPIKVAGNTFNAYNQSADGYGACISSYSSHSSYIAIQNNIGSGNRAAAFIYGRDGGYARVNDHWTISGNVIKSAAVFDSQEDKLIGWDDSVMEKNLWIGHGGAIDSHQMVGFYGTPGHVVTVRNNVWMRGHRAINYGEQTDYNHNLIYWSAHHSISSAAPLYQALGISWTNNLFIGGQDACSLETGYTTASWIDGGIFAHNTFHGNIGACAFAFGDVVDAGGQHYSTAMEVRDNILSSNTTGVRRNPDSINTLTRVHIARADYNNLFGNGSDFSGYNRFATFTQAGVEYNTSLIRNLPGVSLFSPSYSSTFASKSLSLAYTSPTDLTLAWDGGTPVQLTAWSGTAAAGANDSTGLKTGTLSDLGATWPDAPSGNPATPSGMWVKITGGTGVGQVRKIMRNTANVLTVSPVWTTPPDTASTYAIYYSQIKALDSSASGYVEIGIDFRVFPAATLADAGIGMAFHQLAVNPNYVDPTASPATWDASVGGPGDEDDMLIRLKANTGLVFSSLLPYVRGGFTPTNQALKGAGADGGDIGAVDVYAGPTITDASGNGQSTGIGSAFGAALAATVTNSAGNPVAGVTVTFAAPGSGASGTFTGAVLSAAATTNASGTATSPPFTANSTAGNFTVAASSPGIMVNAVFSLTNTSGPIGPSATAAFVKTDSTTQGNWRTSYGADGYNVLGDLAVNPSYAAPLASGQASYTWASSSSEVRALQKGSMPSDRIAATWYAGTSLLIDTNITDTATHQLALYFLDWDTTARRQTIDVLDSNGNVLDTQTLNASFHDGVYLVWNVSGRVKFRLTRSAGTNAVVSALFFGGPAGSPPAAPPSGAAAFLTRDSATHGNWRSAYGADGYSIAGDLFANPSYAAPIASGQASYTWAASTSDVRALQKASTSSDRVAGTWYSANSFLIDSNITDSATHQVALYCLDWDTTTRRETIDVLDSNGTVLNTQALTTSFNGGVYVVWNVSGHIKFRITFTGGTNLVVAGLFFGGPSGPAPPPPPPTATAAFAGIDTTTHGNWRSVYGADGYNIVGDLARNPTYAAPAASGQAAYTWTSSTSDSRALQKASNPADSIAATWYSGNPFLIDTNITDQAPHQVALFCLDWDTNNRRQTIEVLDSNGTVLDTQAMTVSFNGGVYLVWNVTGHVKFRVTWNAGSNAVVSGIFFH